MSELDLNQDELSQSPITARLLDEQERIEILPALFGAQMLRFETYVFGWMRELAEGYDGSYWDMYTLSNGGFYMSPNWPAHYLVRVEGNGFEGTMSADAAAIVANLFALNQLSWEIQDSVFVEHYHWLREFAAEHLESRLIYQAID